MHDECQLQMFMTRYKNCLVELSAKMVSKITDNIIPQIINGKADR
jgi:hypothetical protein